MEVPPFSWANRSSKQRRKGPWGPPWLLFSLLLLCGPQDCLGVGCERMEKRGKKEKERIGHLPHFLSVTCTVNQNKREL